MASSEHRADVCHASAAEGVTAGARRCAMRHSAPMRLAFLSMPYAGHINPLTTLARRLRSRGHTVAFLGVPEAGPIVRAAGLTFLPVGAQEFPAGTLARLQAPISQLTGPAAFDRTVLDVWRPLFTAMVHELPPALVGFDAIVLDAICAPLERVMALPFVRAWTVWPCIDPDALAAVIAGATEDYRPPAAEIAQVPAALSFGGAGAELRYTGPWCDGEGREPVEFPWGQLDGRPILYASLGTLLNGNLAIHRTILDAAAMLPDVQLVLSTGGRITADELGAAPAGAIVVSQAPQPELLQRSAACLTHAGLNTTLEALSVGVPLVALPLGYDQPAVAASIVRSGAGEMIHPWTLTAERLAETIRSVLADPTYRENARRLQASIQEADGLNAAADLVERTLSRC